MESLHHQAIDLGLERLRAVADRLTLAAPAPLVITVAGTNGKGSSAMMLEAVLLAMGYRVGTYTSPHLLRYNERTRIDGHMASDEALCDAFARVDAARRGTSLTYFEFGTLAALDLYARQPLDVVILEVGLGGRLDAVNLVDADLALITSIGLDHIEWLGPDRESIGHEKAGVFRVGRPAVVADADPPQSLLRQARLLEVDLHLCDRDYQYRSFDGHWSWRAEHVAIDQLPIPSLPGRHQIANAAGVLAALHHPALQLSIPNDALYAGLRTASAPGRFEIHHGAVTRIYDVAHNSDSAAALVRCLEEYHTFGATRAVVGMLADKDAACIFRTVESAIDNWYLADLRGPRGRSAESLGAVLGEACPGARFCCCEAVPIAYRRALRDSREGDRVVVFGSFQTVAAITAERV
jgi:dihydrofolate synthase/folylpolyglutamate synthase